MISPLSKADYFPYPPDNAHFSIGIVGCDEIVRGAHLPAYQKVSYDVRIVCDIQENIARETAVEFAIPRWTTNLSDVLDSGVEIIDLAAPADTRRAIVEQICASQHKPRAILSQKPFAFALDDARAMVEMCEAAGIVLMINQQARFAPAHRALKRVIESGELGKIYSIVHFLRAFQDEIDARCGQMPNFNLLDHGSQWIDLTRYFSDQTPTNAKATTIMVPGQNAVSPLIYSATLEYAGGALMSTLHFNNIVKTHATTAHNEWLIDGTRATAMLTGDTLTVVDAATPRSKIVMKTEGAWNDAFAGSMGELMRALDEKREPMCSGRDNLASLRTAQAMLHSSEGGDGRV